MRLLPRELLPRVLDRLGRGWGLRWRNVAAEDIVAPEVQELVRTVTHEATEWNVEDGVKLLERLLFSLGKEEEYEEEASNVPRCIP